VSKSVKFLISVIDDLSGSGTPEEMLAIDAFNDSLREKGHWVFAWGLHAPSEAMVIDNRNDANLSIDGPLFDVQENFCGLWIVDAPSLEVARKLAFAGSKACNRKVELRPFH
jgi:hypothetical protein